MKISTGSKSGFWPWMAMPDDVIQATKDENINLQIADVMIRQVDLLQEKIEIDSTLSGQMKIKNLRSLETMVKGYNNNFRQKDFPPSMAPVLFDAFVIAMDLDRRNQSIRACHSRIQLWCG